MKFAEPSRLTDPDAAPRKLVEIANAIEPAQDGRIYIDLVNGAFLSDRRERPARLPRSRAAPGRSWPRLVWSASGQPHGGAVRSGLTRIPDSSRTSRRVGNVPTTEVQVGLLATCFLASG
jgi:hypothetical protein